MMPVRLSSLCFWMVTLPRLAVPVMLMLFGLVLVLVLVLLSTALVRDMVMMRMEIITIGRCDRSLAGCLVSFLFSCLCLVWFFWLMCLVSRVGWLVCVRRLLLLIPPPRGWCWGWLDCLVGCYWLVTGCSFYDTS